MKLQAQVSWLVLAALAGCATPKALQFPPPPEEPKILLDDAVCVSCGFELEEARVAHFESLARSGDSDAAFRLSLHYGSVDDRKLQTYWTRSAAELGHPVAQYNEWFMLRGSTSCTDRQAALVWLERSAAQGFPSAQDNLKTFRAAVQHCKS